LLVGEKVASAADDRVFLAAAQPATVALHGMLSAEVKDQQRTEDREDAQVKHDAASAGKVAETSESDQGSRGSEEEGERVGEGGDGDRGTSVHDSFDDAVSH